jgi:hypothetical protein
VVKFYNGRGTAEQWIKEGKLALRWTRLSCRAFRDNAVRLQLFALAYTLANFLRSLALPREVAQWSLTPDSPDGLTFCRCMCRIWQLTRDVSRTEMAALRRTRRVKVEEAISRHVSS